MSKHTKQIARLLSKPKDFNWSELMAVMESFGYELKTSGGSARKFFKPEAVFFIHEPHPQKLLKAYQVRAVIAFLKQEGDIQ